MAVRKKAGHIERGGRHHHTQPRAMRENRFAALAVVNRAASEITADGHANDGWTLE